MIGLTPSFEDDLPVRLTGEGDHRDANAGTGDSERDRRRIVFGESFAVGALCEYLLISLECF